MSRIGQSITLSVSEKEKQALEILASEFGLFWGDKPNISKLIKEIARNKLKIAPNHDWKPDRLQMLQQAIDSLIDAGQIPIALELTKLLLERSELSGPLRKELEGRLDNPPPPWRLELDRCILRQQPFQLSYQDAGDRIWEFHLYHAAINRHEDRLYLDCWCEETEGNQDISELNHNWSLRIDRIPNDSLITPIPRGKWRNQLDSVSAEFQLFDGLARSYRTKTAIDIANELISIDPLVRQITRQVTSSFWFFREILPYGEDCLLISPEKVRKRFYDKLQRLYRRYES
jgi:hypothetical protein